MCRPWVTGSFTPALVQTGDLGQIPLPHQCTYVLVATCLCVGGNEEEGHIDATSLRELQLQDCESKSFSKSISLPQRVVPILDVARSRRRS